MGDVVIDVAARPTATDFGFDPSATVIVTGAGAGIGCEIAALAGSMGLHVAVWDLDGAGAHGTADRIRSGGGRSTAQEVDVSDRAAVNGALSELAAAGCSLRYLINNAGPASSSQMPFDEALSLSVGSVESVTNAWLSTAGVSAEAVVNIASVAGTAIGSNPGWYCASKAAIVGYTKHLSLQKAQSVRINSICPGMTATRRLGAFLDTPIGREAVAHIPVGRAADPREIAGPALFLLSPMASYITGTALIVDGGWSIAP